MDREALGRARARWPAAAPRLRALVWPVAAVIASLVFGNGLAARVAEGWRKTEAVMRLEQELEQSQAEHRRLGARVRQLETPEGQKLEARRCERVNPHERAIILQPVLPSENPRQQPTWSDRAAALRTQAAAALREQWRIFVRWAFGVRLPVLEGTDAASLPPSR